MNHTKSTKVDTPIIRVIILLQNEVNQPPLVSSFSLLDSFLVLSILFSCSPSIDSITFWSFLNYSLKFWACYFIPLATSNIWSLIFASSVSWLLAPFSRYYFFFSSYSFLVHRTFSCNFSIYFLVSFICSGVMIGFCSSTDCSLAN